MIAESVAAVRPRPAYPPARGVLLPAQHEALVRSAHRVWGDVPEQVRAVLGDAASFDHELDAVASGRAFAAIKSCDSMAEAELVAQACVALGFMAEATNGDDGPAALVTLDAGTMVELGRFYRVAGSGDRRRVVEAIGKLLGYPTCCIGAYSTQAQRGPRAHDERETFRRQLLKPLHAPLNRLGAVKVISHHPCRPDCGGSLTLAETVLARLRAIAPGAENKALEAIRRPVLHVANARVVVEGEWIGSTFELERAEPLDEPPRGRALWSRADRLEFGPSTVVLVAQGEERHEIAESAPLLLEPGAPLAPAAVEALIGSPVVETHKMPDLPWLGYTRGLAADGGFTFTDARHAQDRLELVFSKGGKVLTAWCAPRGDKPSFKRNDHISFGYVGQKLEPAEMALLEGVWKKADAAGAAVVESIQAYAAAQAALEEVPRNSRPTRWLGEGEPPPPRLKVLGSKDVERFFHVDYEWGEQEGGATSRVGVIYRCNQWCGFCNLSDMDVKLPPEKVRAAIERARARGSEEIILTGGEPTLSPHILEYVGHAKELGFKQITMQSNAIRIARSDLASKLRQAGLTKAQVSLHGPDAAISDRLTQAPGTHAKTVEGLTKLVEQGVTILVNHLIFKQNAHLLVDFVEFCRRHWGQNANLLVLQFRSPKHEFNTDSDALAHTPKYSDYVPQLLAAMELARSYGFSTSHILDPVGVPSLCILESAKVDVNAVIEADDHPAHHAWESDWFTRIEACRTCGVSGACQGVRKDYVELFGESEFHPLPVLPAMAKRRKA